MMQSSSDNFGNLKLIEGLAICPNWLNSDEGPFTFLAKVALANSLNARQICRTLGFTLSKNYNSRSYSRSLLQLEWIFRSERSPKISENLLRRGLISKFEYLSKLIANDHFFRYCPACLEIGYQSSLCQLEGLTHCPEHNIELIDHCRTCGLSTPPYAITPESFDNPLICSQCRTAYASIWYPANHSKLYQSYPREEGYIRLGRWLTKLEKMTVRWPDRSGWLNYPGMDKISCEKIRQTHILNLLKNIVPPPPGLIFRTSQVKTMCWAASSEAPYIKNNSSTEQLKTINARITIYKSIRRHYSRKSRLKIESRILVNNGKMIHNNNGMLMPVSDSVDPMQHGINAWRLRFERNLKKMPSIKNLEIYEILLYWPEKWLASENAWGHFAHQCLLMDLESARGLNIALHGLDYNQKESFPAWLEVVNSWNYRFGSNIRPWPYSLSTFHIDGHSGNPDIIYLIVAPGSIQT